MLSLSANITSFLSLGTLIADVFIIAIVVLFLLGKVFNAPHKILSNIISGFVGVWSFHIAFFVALSATLGSLFYSSVVGFEPCILCWYQRIMLFPQVVILGIALFIKDQKAIWYGIALSIIGMLVSHYHYYGQMFNISALPCSEPGASGVSCAQRVIFEYGYITMPLMAATAFALIIIFLLISRAHNKQI